MTLYEDLGVSKGADKATIKRAYRKRAQKEHPDKGGDATKFHSLQRAYDVLGDDARRAHYDKHGTDGQLDHRGMLMQRLAALFMHVVESNDVDHVDLVALMKQALVQGKATTQQHINGNVNKIAKYERAKKRLKHKGNEPNVFEQMLDGQIAMLTRNNELNKAEIENTEEMLRIVSEYQYHANSSGVRGAMQMQDVIHAMQQTYR